MKRTQQQNKCLHSYLTQVAAEMDAAGLDMRAVITVPIKPTLENVKHEMFKPVMRKTFPGVESTTELTTIQMQEVYEGFNAAIAQSLGISGDWPNYENKGEIQ